MDATKMQAVLDDVECGAWEMVLGTNNGADYYLQVRQYGKCNVTGKPYTLQGRKWRLSRFMTRSEIVQTALKAVLTAEEHEVRERFKYRGRPIFDPHYDVDRLWALRGEGEQALDVRPEPEPEPVQDKFNNEEKFKSDPRWLS